MNLLDNEKNEINYILRELEKNISNQEDEAIKNKYIDLKSQYYRQRESQNTLANLTKTYLSTGLFLIVLAVSFPVVIVFSKATLSKINYDVEEIKKEIEAQSKTNEGLNMQIGELASLDKVQEVAKNQGLSYNSSNIKSIEDN